MNLSFTSTKLSAYTIKHLVKFGIRATNFFQVISIMEKQYQLTLDIISLNDHECKYAINGSNICTIILSPTKSIYDELAMNLVETLNLVE